MRSSSVTQEATPLPFYPPLETLLAHNSNPTTQAITPISTGNFSLQNRPNNRDQNRDM